MQLCVCVCFGFVVTRAGRGGVKSTRIKVSWFAVLGQIQCVALELEMLFRRVREERLLLAPGMMRAAFPQWNLRCRSHVRK